MKPGINYLILNGLKVSTAIINIYKIPFQSQKVIYLFLLARHLTLVRFNNLDMLIILSQCKNLMKKNFFFFKVPNKFDMKPLNLGELDKKLCKFGWLHHPVN